MQKQARQHASWHPSYNIFTFYNTFVLIEIDEESIDKKIKLKYDQYKDLYELEGKIFSVLSDYL